MRRRTMDERPIEEKYLWGRISRDLYQVGEQTYTSSWKLEDMAKKEWAKEINIRDDMLKAKDYGSSFGEYHLSGSRI
jgi:hypothetical protein